MREEEKLWKKMLGFSVGDLVTWESLTSAPVPTKRFLKVAYPLPENGSIPKRGSPLGESGMPKEKLSQDRDMALVKSCATSKRKEGGDE